MTMPTRTGGIGIDWDGNETVSKQHELVNSKNLCKTNSTITTGRSSSASFSSTSLASIALNNKGIHKMIPPWLEGSDVIVRTKEQCNINEACSDTDEDDDDYDEPMRIVSTNYSRGFRNVAESTGKFTHYNTVVHPMIIDEHSSLKKQSKKTLRSMLCGKQKKKQNFSSDELRGRNNSSSSSSSSIIKVSNINKRSFRPQHFFVAILLEIWTTLH